MGLIDARLGLDALATVDLLIEAVFEEISVKTDVFRKPDRIAKPAAILASNTSYLDLDDLAARRRRVRRSPPL